MLALSMTRRSIDWSPDLVERVQLVVAIIGSVIQRQESDKSFHEWLELDRMMAELSATFINLPGERVDVEILGAMACLCEFLDIDMCTFIQRETEDGALRHTHQWNKPSLDMAIDFTDFDFATEAPWVAAQISAMKSIAIRDF